MLVARLPGFLGPADAARVLAYAIESEARFVPSGVGAVERLDNQVRSSSRLESLGPVKELFEAAVRARIPELIAALGVNPFELSGLELEIVATGPGGFYRRHVDLITGEDRKTRDTDRVLSLVYYLHREPKPFSGGELKVYPMWSAGDTLAPETVTPQHDMAVAFSSWAPHEILEVTGSSQLFADSRFTVNCWVLRPQQGA